MTIYEKIKMLREEKGMSQQELAEKVGFKTASAVNKIELGLRDINQTKILAFAKALGTTPSFLLDTENDYLNLLPDLLPIPKMIKKPRLGIIACGEPILTEENFEAYDSVPENIDCDFTLQCKGDSMINARICDGDIVYIKSQSIVDNGQIAAVMINDEITLKRVFIYENKVVLQAENPKYEPFVYVNDELNNITILGKAVGFYSNIR